MGGLSMGSLSMSGFSMVGFFKDGFSMEGLCVGCLSMGGFTMDGWFIHWQFDHQRTRSWRGAARHGSAVLHKEHRARGTGRGRGVGKEGQGLLPWRKHSPENHCQMQHYHRYSWRKTPHCNSRILKENLQCRHTVSYSPSFSLSFRSPNQQRSSSNSRQEATTHVCGEGALSAEPALLLYQANADFTF